MPVLYERPIFTRRNLSAPLSCHSVLGEQQPLDPAGYLGRGLDIGPANGAADAVADLDVVVGDDSCRAPPGGRGRHLVYSVLLQVTFLLVAGCPSDAAGPSVAVR